MAKRSAEDATTAGMKAEGFYDAHSEYQRRVIEGGDQLIRETVADLGLNSGEGAITVVDYGSGTGATSAHAMGTALTALRGREPKRALEAIHNDIPGNDFTGLFENLAAKDGYLQTVEGPIYPLAAAGSFFQQVLPGDGVQLGMCSNAAHWLREQPRISIPDGMYFCEATGSEREGIAEQAAGDWLLFLSARAAELAPGGRMLVQGIASSDDGERVSASKLLRSMWRAAADLAEEEVLDRETLERYVFPVYCRSPSEGTAPLEKEGPLAGSLEPITARLEEVANPYWELFERDGDAEAYAKTYVEFVRAFAETAMLAGLFEPGARGIEPADLCDRYFNRLRELNATDPESGRYECWILRLVVERR
jgi:S-adenosylmethionine-dependent carboxyl methyltransferase